MRFLILGLNYAPELTGIGKYTGEMAEWLSAQGHDVRVVTAPPYYPQWKIADGFANTWSISKSERTVDPATNRLRGSLVVYRCPLWVPSRPSGLQRLLHLASFALSSLPVMLFQVLWRPAVVWVVEPPLLCAPQAWLVARMSGGKAWLHIQDYEVDAAFDLGLLKGRLLRRMATLGERWMMRRFDRVSSISQQMVERAVKKGVATGRVKLFRNWADIAGLKIVPSAEGSMRRELGIADDAIVALYSGNMGAKQGLDVLAEVAKRAPGVEFVFCGNGAGRDDLAALCENLPNVRFLDLQPAQRLGELLCMADIHLLPQRAEASGLVMPSKLTGMFASGRPVVATAQPESDLAEVVAGRGLVVPPNDGKSFSDAINVLSADAEFRIRLGMSGREYALAHLDKDVVLGIFEAELLALAGKSGQ